MIKRSRKKSSVRIKKKSEEIVLDFDEDGELDLVKKLDNPDCIIYFIDLIQPFQMLDCDCQQI